jgi:hypothetical protein
MDAKDIRNLSEAYMEVYSPQEELQEAEKWIQKAIKKPGALSKQLGVPEKENIPAKKLAAAAKKGGKLGRRARLAQTLKSLHKEEVDIYDIILSHLLDEGYAETVEAAEVMMVNMSEDWRDSIVEATAMAKRGHDEASIRQRIAQSTGGGEAADRATNLADRPTYGDSKTAQQRQNLARKQRGDFRKTTSSSPGLHGYAHKSDDPEVKAKQAARGAQRGALTPREKKQLGR